MQSGEETRTGLFELQSIDFSLLEALRTTADETLPGKPPHSCRLEIHQFGPRFRLEAGKARVGGQAASAGWRGFEGDDHGVLPPTTLEHIVQHKERVGCTKAVATGPKRGWVNRHVPEVGINLRIAGENNSISSM